MDQQTLQLVPTESSQVQAQKMPEIQLAPLPYNAPFNIQSNKDLAEKLSWKSTKLLTMLGKNKSEHYSVLSLRKKSGKLRILHNPDSLMRVVQYKILSRVLDKINVPDYIHAFEKGRSIPAMAEQHVGKGTIISIDLKDFFTSIKQYHLLSLFKHLGFGDNPARTLSELCTYKSFVPQGALTSPKISNIITSLTFGPTLKKYCDDNGFTLSIYADDITISMDAVLTRSTGGGIVETIIEYVSDVVRSYGFRINRAKTKVMRPYQRQYVCGVVVNRKINLQKTERNKLRAMVHNCVINGVEAEAAKNDVTSGEFYSRLLGRLNWFSQLNPVAGGRLKELLMNQVVVEQCQPNAETVAVEAVMSAGSQQNQQEPSAALDVPW